MRRQRVKKQAGITTTVSKILAKIVTDGKDKLRHVYDPTCGFRFTVVTCLVKENAGVYRYFGQERNNTTYNLARMNMLLHDVRYENFDIRNDDTLENPAF
ncbi:N-6 DNA methylase [Staphylococcus aureus]